MKIAILGPVCTNDYFGGVATFDENLAIAYKKIDDKNEVFLYSEQVKSQSKNSYGIIVHPINILSAFKQENFDLAIVSLEYAKYLPIIKAHEKIYFLHGFFSLSAYSPLKTILAVTYQKFFLQYVDCIIGNSKFTCFINREIYRINPQGFVHLGVSYDYLKKLNEKKEVYREPHSILFTGRLIEAKKVNNIIRAMKVLKNTVNNSYVLRIVGDGDLKPWLVKYAKKNDLNVKFYNRVSQSEIVEFYKESQIFISLNPTEPFGITFCEALLAGCQIICPDTGGQVEFLSEYPRISRMISNLRPETIAKAVIELENETSCDSVKICDFLYENTARDILKIMRECKK